LIAKAWQGGQVWHGGQYEASSDENFLKQAEEAVKQNALTFLKKPLAIDKLLLILERIQHQLYSSFMEKPGAENE
jgi:DNA-binding NtrC family response regulator